MLNEILDCLGGAMAVNEGLQTEDSAVLEITELETFENKSYLSEVDEIRVNEKDALVKRIESNEVSSHEYSGYTVDNF